MPDPAHVVETTPNDETMELIDLVAADAAAVLGISIGDDTKVILEAIHQCLRDIQKGAGPELNEDDDIIMLLGALWGNHLVKELSWEWANIDLTDRDPPFAAIGVVSPNRDKVIYPFNFISLCLEKDVLLNVLLVYNVLVEKPEEVTFEPGSCENVMTRIAHIVPPE